MKQSFWVVVVLLAALKSSAQQSITFYIKNKGEKTSVPGAVIRVLNSNVGTATDELGYGTLYNLAVGAHTIVISAMGYEERMEQLTIPMAIDTITVALEGNEEELEETVVSTTRSSRSILDIPTRIETVSGEELEEKGNMKPGDIRMLLAESTGIQVLQTSALSGNSVIRIQGMDGRYTQILKDGLPIYSGYASGLGLLQTPPLNLKRAEIVKGAASTLYGGGAIAGLVNLVSKTPAEERELKFLSNYTSAGGLDINGFYGQRFGKIGVTIYAARNSAKGYKLDKYSDYTVIPQSLRYTLNPKLFFYLSETSELSVGLNATQEERTGGLVNSNGFVPLSGYYEQNKSGRVSTELEWKKKMNDRDRITVKHSYLSFDRKLQSPGYTFGGRQQSTFGEVSWSRDKKEEDWVIGGNVYTDNFTEKRQANVPDRSYTLTTIGAFVQNTHNINSKWILESGLRTDYINDYGFAVLPRLSMLTKISPKVTSRLGGGLGYKAPTIFTEETERMQYSGLAPIASVASKLERSYGANWDWNYRTTLADDAIVFTANQLFFYTRVNNPLLLLMQPASNVHYLYNDNNLHTDAYGGETNLKLSYKHLKLFVGYTYTHSMLHSGNFTLQQPLVPRHRTNTVLMYEVEDKWKIGLEAYYYSPTKLNDFFEYGRDYWLTGAMVEKIWERWSVFVNFENLLNVSQIGFRSEYASGFYKQNFRDLFAPIEGRIINGGIKLKL